MTRRVLIDGAFTDGLVTDAPAHLLGPRMAAVAQNLIVIDGTARRRRGWRYVGKTHANALTGVRSADFALSGRTRRMVTTSAGVFDDFAGSNIVQVSNRDDYLPRCLYRDEMILCSQDGQLGILRYAGAGWNDGTNNSFEYEGRQTAGAGAGNPVTIAMNTTAGSAQFTYTLPGVNSANIVSLVDLTDDASSFFVNWARGSMPVMGTKIVNISATDTGTLLSAISSGSWSSTASTVNSVGYAYPAVAVYGAGTITVAASTATGQGTEWSTGAWGSITLALDSVLASIGGTAYHVAVNALASDTSMTAVGLPDTTTPSQYFITRGLPFADACVHRDSLVGTGCAQFPNRVYICPPGWDMESPPGGTPPTILAATTFQNADTNHFLVDFIDVPSSVDTDPVVTVISSPGPLLVIKTDDAHGIYGEYPNFTQALLPGGQGAGCIDRRSRVSCRWGQLWAGRNGIHLYAGSRVYDITENKINTTWRNLVADHLSQTGFYCAMGVSGDKLLVSIGHDGDTGSTLCYDLARQTWDGYFTNHQAVGFDSPTDEARSLIWAAAPIASDPERLRDSSELLDGDGPVIDGALTTTAEAPVMTAVTSSGLIRHDGNDGLAKVIDCSVTASLTSGTSGGVPTGHSELRYQVATSGGIDNEAVAVTPATAKVMTANAALAPRTRSRVPVGRNARFASVNFTTESTPTANATTDDYDVIVRQLAITVRDSRDRA